MSHPTFHPGEYYIRQQTGELGIGMRNEGMIDDQVTGGAAAFVEKQPFFFAASVDENGKVWASVLSGLPGFVSFEGPHLLCLDPALLTSDPADIFWKNLLSGSGAGLLFIELGTRRRFRVNGDMVKTGNRWKLAIGQAYPNCPKYIQRRVPADPDSGLESAGTEIENWIRRSDTFFVASTDREGNLDISHRGGRVGFSRMKDEDTICVPDYPGNSMFNTLGNFHENSQAGILLVDFANGETLQMTGEVTINLEDNDHDFTGGTGRSWDFTIRQSVFKQSLKDFGMRLVDFSPFNP